MKIETKTYFNQMQNRLIECTVKEEPRSKVNLNWVKVIFNNSRFWWVQERMWQGAG